MTAFFARTVGLSLVLIWPGSQGGAAWAQSADAMAVLTDLSLEELLNIEVLSVSRRPERLADTPSSIQVITDEQIRRSGASNIPEVLRLASNLNIAQQNSHEWIISARGFSSDVGNKLLVMMDGRTVYTPLFSGVFWDRQDYLLEDLERVEVVSGPGGSLWGANAVNGVINILSKTAADTQGWYAEGAAGNRLESLAAMRYGGTLPGRGHFRVYGKHADRNSEHLSSGADGLDPWWIGQLGFRADSDAVRSDRFTLQGDYHTTESWLASGGESRTRGGNLLARWTRDLSVASNINLQVYYDQTALVLPVPEFRVNGTLLAPAGTFRDTLDTVDVDFQHSFRYNRGQKIVWGLGYRWTYDQVENAPGLGFLPESLQQDLISAFFQDEITLITDKLALTLGTKVENNSYTDVEWEPSARLRWDLSAEQMLWTAISRAVRMPSRIDRDIRQGVPPHFVLLSGGEDFDSEKVLAYEAGYRTLLGDQLAVSVAAFHNEYSSVRSTRLAPTIFPLYFANDLEGDTQGIELSLTYQAAEWWQIHAGYNYLREDLRVKPGGYDFNNAHNETADPKNQFSLRSAMNLADAVTMDFAYRWVDKLPTNNAGELVFVPSYSEVDFRLACALQDNLEVALIGRNVLHKHHQEFGIPGPGQEEVGRSLYLKLQLRH